MLAWLQDHKDSRQLEVMWWFTAGLLAMCDEHGRGVGLEVLLSWWLPWLLGDGERVLMCTDEMELIYLLQVDDNANPMDSALLSLKMLIRVVEEVAHCCGIQHSSSEHFAVVLRSLVTVLVHYLDMLLMGVHVLSPLDFSHIPANAGIGALLVHCPNVLSHVVSVYESDVVCAPASAMASHSCEQAAYFLRHLASAHVTSLPARSPMPRFVTNCLGSTRVDLQSAAMLCVYNCAAFAGNVGVGNALSSLTSDSPISRQSLKMLAKLCPEAAGWVSLKLVRKLPVFCPLHVTR